MNATAATAALTAYVPSATARNMFAAEITRAVAKAQTDHGRYAVQMLASDVPTFQRGQAVQDIWESMGKVIVPAAVEAAVKAAATAALAA